MRNPNLAIKGGLLGSLPVGLAGAVLGARKGGQVGGRAAAGVADYTQKKFSKKPEEKKEEKSEKDKEKESAQKCRKGSTPIRAHNLANKSKYDGRGKKTTKLAFFQEKQANVAKILQGAKALGQKGLQAGEQLGKKTIESYKALSPEAKSKLHIGAGAFGAGALGHQAYQDAMLGRRVRRSQGM